MKSTTSNSLFQALFIILSLFVLAKAIPEEGAETPPAAAGGNGTAGDKIVLDAPTTPSPEEIEIDEAIKELKSKQCKLVYANCWVAYVNNKPYFTEEKRMKLCLKRTQGFSVCESMTEDEANEAKGEAEEKIKKMREEEEEREREKLAAEETEAPQ